METVYVSQGDLPLAVGEDDLALLEKSARLIIRADFPAELGPHLFFAGAENLPQDSHADISQLPDGTAKSRSKGYVLLQCTSGGEYGSFRWEVPNPLW